MISEQEDRLTHHAIRAIVQQACLRLRQRENVRYNRDVLEALHDMTGLPCSELAEIAREVSPQKDPAFFSIKHQVMMAGGFLFGITGILFFALRLLS